MGEVTKLAKATSQSGSLRTTVPSGIVHQLDLKEGDKLEWKITPKADKLVLLVIPKNK